MREIKIPACGLYNLRNTDKLPYTLNLYDTNVKLQDGSLTHRRHVNVLSLTRLLKSSAFCIFCYASNKNCTTAGLILELRRGQSGERGGREARFPSKGINRRRELERAREIYVREACIRERLYY